MTQDNSESGVTEIKLTELEATPPVILQAGISRYEKGRLTVILMLDTSKRPDINAVFEAHRTQQEGGCTSVWATPPDNSNVAWLILSFKKPVTTRVLIEFDVLQFGPLIDRIIDGHSIALVQGLPGDKLDVATQDKRGVLNMEVGATFVGWDKFWKNAITSITGLDPNQSESLVEMYRAETIIRANNPAIPPFKELASIFLDEKGKQIIFASNKMLVNQLHRDGPVVAASFDKHFWDEIEVLSPEFSRINSYIAFGTMRAAQTHDEVKMLAGQLMGNALNNIMGATELARLGYRLQPGILLRPAIEWAGMAGYLFRHPESTGRFKAGKLNSTEIIGLVGRDINPIIPKAWGFLSQDFIHVGKLHQRVQIPEVYENVDDASVKTNLLGIHITLMIVTILVELIFYEVVNRHEYWKEVEPGKFEFLNESPVWQRLEEIASRLSVQSEQQQDPGSKEGH